MRISDWSSDVCSSDLHVARHWLGEAFDRHRIAPLQGIEARQIRTARVDQNFATTRLLAQPRRKVHRRTDRGVFKPRRRADHANRDRSEEHTSELQSLMRISYAVFCLKKKKKTQN